MHKNKYKNENLIQNGKPYKTIQQENHTKMTTIYKNLIYTKHV